MACAPLPATFIFARVAAESRGLKSQKIHVRKPGTFTKNLWACGAGCGGARGQGVCQPACGEGEEGGRGCVRGTRGSGSGICCWLRRLRLWSSRCGCSSRRPRSLSARARVCDEVGRCGSRDGLFNARRTVHLYHLVDGLEVHQCDAALHERDAPPVGDGGQRAVIVEAKSNDERGTYRRKRCTSPNTASRSLFAP